MWSRADSARKHAELTIKLEALAIELDAWLDAAAPGEDLEKHNSQLQRVVGELKPLLQGIQAGVDADDIAATWPSIERQVLDLHRVWNFFRDRLALRMVPWLREYLRAADEYAWAAYEPVQQAAIGHGSLRPEAVREPPLVGFSSTSTPFSIARGSSYARELEAVETPVAKEMVAALPIPVIAVPWFQLRHLPDALIIGHEVGHVVWQDFALSAPAFALIDQALAGARAPAVEPRWHAWLEEVFADVYGALVGGPAYALSLGDFLLVSGVDPAADGDPSYPPSALRLALTIAALRQAECATGHLESRFAAILGVLTSAEKIETDRVAGALVGGDLTKLGGALSGVIDPRIPVRGEQEASRVLHHGWPPRTGNIRTLFASAAYAFSAEPESYRERDLTGLLLARAKLIQQPGTRFRGGGRTRDEAAIARADEGASQKLYQILTG